MSYINEVSIVFLIYHTGNIINFNNYQYLTIFIFAGCFAWYFGTNCQLSRCHCPRISYGMYNTGTYV